MIVFVALVAFAVSLPFLYLSRRSVAGNQVCSGDTFFHLLISDSIRKNHGRFPSSFPNVTFDEGEKKYSYLAYPPLFHYVVALFPAKFSLNVAKYLNLVILSLVSALAAVCVYRVTSNLAFTVLACFIVIFNMSVFELEVMFTPRPLGLLLYSIIFYMAVFYPHSLLSTLIIALVISLIFLTHKFALQVILFILVPYAVLFNEGFLIFGLILGFLLAIILSHGTYLKILKEHASWLYFYSKHPNHSPFSYKLRRVFLRNLYLLVLIPIVFFLAWNGSLLSDTLALKVLFWALAPLVVALIITIPALSFLGEDYRYIEYSVVPVALAISIFLVDLQVFVLSALALFFFAYVVVLSKYKKHLYEARELVDADDIFSYECLGKCDLKNLLVFPSTRTLEVNYFTKLHVIHQVRSKDNDQKVSLEYVVNNYNIRYVISFKDADPFHRYATLLTFANVKKLQEFKNFELIEVTRKYL